MRQNKYTVGTRKLWSVFIAINFNISINEIEENWEKPTFFIQDGGYLFTNSMSGAARLPALKLCTRPNIFPYCTVKRLITYNFIECLARKTICCLFMLLPYFETVSLLAFASLCCWVFIFFSLETFFIILSCHSFCNSLYY